MTLPELISELPDGQRAATLSWEETIGWIRNRYLTPMGEEETRIRDAQERHDLYRDRGQRYICELIDLVFDDPDVKRLRDKWVESAGYNNCTRRVVHELATLYRRPAIRSVAGPEDNLRFQAVQRLVQMDTVMLEAQRLAILQRACLIAPRVPSWSRVPVLDIIEPHHFRLITHPLDPTRWIGSIIDQAMDAPGMPSADRPAFVVWTATESFRLSQSGKLTGPVQPHPFGRIPQVLVALSPPPGRLIDCHTFRDVIRAHKAVWFENVLLLKESKSATKASVLTGDLSRATRKQALDNDAGPLQLPEGTALTPVDFSMDLGMFRDTADHILERAAANHGIPPAILHQAGATSGYEIELRYVGVRERRIEQEPYFRAVERDLADLLAVVLAFDLPELAFNTAGFSIDFGEIQMPLSAMEEAQNFQTRRGLGLTDTIEEIQRLNPDLQGNDPEAWAEILRHIQVETDRMRAMRELQALAGSMGKPDAGQGAAPAPPPAEGVVP